MRGDLDRGFLKVEKPLPEFRRDAKLGQAGARFLGEVVGHLDVDHVRLERLFPRPAFLDDLDQLVGDVDAPAVVPAVLEPVGKLCRGVVIEHIDVQLALLGQPGESEVAAAQKAGDRVDRIWSEEQVELGVKRMLQKQLDRDLA